MAMSALGGMLRRSGGLGSRSMHSMSAMMNTNIVRTFPVPECVKQVHDSKGWAKMEFRAAEEDLSQINKYVVERLATEQPKNVANGAVHGFDAGLDSSLMDRLASTALSFLGCDSVYVYQLRVDMKTPSKDAASGTLRRDVDLWHDIESMPTTNAIVFHILLSDQTDSHGPVVFVDGSHDVADPQARAGESNLKNVLPLSLIAEQPCTGLTGSRGTVASMHPLTLHYGSPDVDTKNKVLFSVVFNDLSNQPLQPKAAALQYMEHNIWKREPAALREQSVRATKRSAPKANMCTDILGSRAEVQLAQE